MRARSPLVLAAALALSLTACNGGGSDEATPPPPPVDGELRLVGDTSIRWGNDAPRAVAVDGALAITLICDGSVPHSVAIEGIAPVAPVSDGATAEEDLLICDGGETSTGTIDIDPGSYAFYCTVTGHRASGMEGVLTVSAPVS